MEIVVIIMLIIICVICIVHDTEIDAIKAELKQKGDRDGV